MQPELHLHTYAFSLKTILATRRTYSLNILSNGGGQL